MKTQTDVIHTDYLYPNGRVELPIVPQSSNDPLAEYALQMLSWYATSSPIDDVLHEMEELAESDNIPIIGPLEGAILQVCLQMRQPPPKADFGYWYSHRIFGVVDGARPPDRLQNHQH